MDSVLKFSVTSVFVVELSLDSIHMQIFQSLSFTACCLLFHKHEVPVLWNAIKILLMSFCTVWLWLF